MSSRTIVLTEHTDHWGEGAVEIIAGKIILEYFFIIINIDLLY